MTVLSKLTPKVIEQGRFPMEGGWFARDFHVWIQHKKTGDITDFHLREHDISCMLNNCDVYDPIFHPWIHQEYWINEYINKEFWDYIPEIVKMYGDTPKYQCCPQNCIAWINKTEERRENYKLVIGSRGWKDRDGIKSWYEWG
tara:strand:- start:44 stop:472 length:429 start_codon:yes stop_codon:yes gene_type:complete